MRRIDLYVTAIGLGMFDEHVHGRCKVTIEVHWDFQPEEIDFEWSDTTELEEDSE